MKKNLLSFIFLLVAFVANAQVDYYSGLPNDGSSSGSGRAPRTDAKFSRVVYLITANELADAGLVNGAKITSVGFNYSVAPSVPVTTTAFAMYLQNTTDVTNAKSNTWSTVVSDMTSVTTSNITIPATTGISYINVTSFTYTGGGLYVAYDYQNTGTTSTANRVLTNTKLANGWLGAVTGGPTVTAPSTTITSVSGFRPQTEFTISVDCARPTTQSFANSTKTTVDLNWTGTGSKFDVEYGADGYTQGTGTAVNGVTGTTTSLSGLTSGTVYNFYVRTDCGNGSTSIWKGPYAFHTAFDAADPTYTESFESYDLPFVGWKADAAPNFTSWFSAYSPGAPTVQDGNATLLSYNSTVAASTARMYSRGVNLKAGTITVKYWVGNDKSATSTGSADYELSMGNDQTAVAQTIVLKSETGLANTAMVEKTVTYDLPVGEDGVYYFGFLNNSPVEPTTAQFNGISVDLFSVEQTTTLSNNEFFSSKFSVSPNPASSVVNITNGDNMLVNGVTVTDLNGRTVKNVSFEGVASAQVNVADLASGMYIMNVTSDKGTATKKFVKN
jgi:hypothetical protein